MNNNNNKKKGLSRCIRLTFFYFWYFTYLNTATQGHNAKSLQPCH